MATMTSRDTRTMIAGGDLSANQFHFVTQAADGQIDVTGDGLRADGVLLNDPDAAGKAATVVVSGNVMVKAGGEVTVGANVASDATGRAVVAVADDIVMGYARSAGAANEIITIELIQGGNAEPA